MFSSSRVRLPAVSGLFYPDNPAELRAEVERYLAEAAKAVPKPAPPKALVAPHAGYHYSGPVAASAFVTLRAAAGRIRRVVLLGPSHHFSFSGLASTSAVAYRTPLGDVPVDRDALAALADMPEVRLYDAAHGPEHSLEVELPFLQAVLGEFSLVPLVTGNVGPAEVADVLFQVWGGPETVIVVSTDLSHFHGYEAARRVDAVTCRAVEALDGLALTPERACGCSGLAGLLQAARAHGLTVHTLDLRNSGDTAGDRTRVVGYGAWALAA